MKHTLILFSGQTDSIESVVNFSNQNKNILVDLLYIKNVGFRNCNEIPVDAVSALSMTLGQIRNFYVIDGVNCQRQTLEEYAANLSERTVIIYDCCMVCQFTLHSLYVYAANILDCNIMLPKNNLFPHNIMKIITCPYEECRKDIKKYNYPDIQIQTNIKKTELVERCQLACFHNYKFKNMPLVENEKWFKEYKVFEKWNKKIERVELSCHNTKGVNYNVID